LLSKRLPKEKYAGASWTSFGAALKPRLGAAANFCHGMVFFSVSTSFFGSELTPRKLPYIPAPQRPNDKLAKKRFDAYLI
jgi:hypothetical protein